MNYENISFVSIIDALDVEEITWVLFLVHVNVFAPSNMYFNL